MTLTIVLICFFILLTLSMPIALLLAATTAIYLIFIAHVPVTSLIQQLFNGLDNFVLLGVPFFILAGNIMAEGAISDRLVGVMKLFVGRFTGGLALASVLACMVFAAISGSSPATVIAIGSIMMPALIKEGYGNRFSIGLLTSSGSLGILIPPSIPMILYALVMNVSVAEIFMAGFLPGIFIGCSLMGYSYYMARKHGWRSQVHYSFKEGLKIIKDGLWALFLPVLVLGGIYGGIFTPTEAAAVSVVYALFVELFIYKELKIGKLFNICRDSAILSGCLLFILSCAMSFIWLLTVEQIPIKLAEAIVSNIQNKWLFLLAINGVLLIIGALMDIVTAIIVISPILVETLSRYDIDFIHYGIIMIVNIECGFLTPPFGLNLFVAMAIMKRSLVEIGKSILPFILLFLGCLVIITYVPQLSTLLPKLLLR
ncbi:MAG: TRAP transporter large permease subunit [Syntrophorhabdus sp.]|jgi:C4-dicarboxylate transporter DctM subunit|nr:TRAP transporter large permease subunit [Syntrophorhabdus sp.]MDI9558756.1 TRAP transporter large permease subunit [Pseudomonadota bacterium]OPX93656.1 MAG: Sialic acid TRAP transporter permease protein SiaT [Syntrophorhabdus sp. PtaB.Bin027]OQB75330.1 MAG: Sialic acid TRAP transporter permease protein SiaT [Deltaproteobacteria bacterium ADurb.Bin135]MBP8744450.1 TRAP transporter large permease subunit [Syntrophorhabdus sp.]